VSDRIVIYHGPGCADGFTAAWVAWTVYGEKHRNGELTSYLAAQYGDEPPDVTGKEVLIVDFSYPRAVLLDMAAKAKSVRVFDHHAGAQRDLAGLDFCVFDMHRSGAAITWDMLRQGDRRPLLVELVQDRDLWRWKVNGSKALNAWIGVQRHDFILWDMIAKQLEDKSESTIARSSRLWECGEAILKHIEAYVESTAKTARMMSVGGHIVPVVNAPGMMVSELVGKLAEGQPFAVGWHQLEDGRFKYSLRSRKGGLDVSRVAEAYGGSGHAPAAGFVSRLPPSGLFAEVVDHAD
jgi:nanoRNase/pAp phosphatase (c-di-AMP/oligoRNAs hydrolase)